MGILVDYPARAGGNPQVWQARGNVPTALCILLAFSQLKHG